MALLIKLLFPSSRSGRVELVVNTLVNLVHNITDGVL